MSKRRITIDLEEALLKAADAAALERRTSRNQLISEAVERLLDEWERERIDAAFAEIAEDSGYQELLLQMELQWAPASDESWRLLNRAEERCR